MLIQPIVTVSMFACCVATLQAGAEGRMAVLGSEDDRPLAVKF